MAEGPPSPVQSSVDVEKGTAKRASLDGMTITPDLDSGTIDADEKGPDEKARDEKGANENGGAVIEVGQQEQDPDVVSWDGPDDPQNPVNWPDSKKWFNITVLSVLTIIT